MSALQLYEECVERAAAENLSGVLPLVLRLGKELGNEELERWARLEFEGYWDSNPVLTAKTEVPRYRWVGGQWSSPAGRPVIVGEAAIAFLNQIPLRHGVAELERMGASTGVFRIPSAPGFDFISEKFATPVSDFTFSATSIAGVLSAIRVKLLDLLGHVRGSLGSKQERGARRRTGHASLDVELLHPRVVELAGALYDDGHFRNAVLDTFVGLEQDVRAKSGVRELTGSALMQRVFSPKSPMLRAAPDDDGQLGLMWLFSGAIMMLRNPRAHAIEDEKDPQACLEWLGFGSALFKVLDKAQAVAQGQTPST